MTPAEGINAVAAGSGPLHASASMAQLIVRRLEDDLVRALKVRAARKGHSAEEEHREILRAALRGERGRQSLKALLQTIPVVGSDDDFAIARDQARRVRL